MAAANLKSVDLELSSDTIYLNNGSFETAADDARKIAANQAATLGVTVNGTPADGKNAYVH